MGRAAHVGLFSADGDEVQRIDTTPITVTDLAVEFGLSIEEMLVMCEMLDVATDGAGTVLDGPSLRVLRGVVSGEIDPEDLPAGEGSDPHHAAAPGSDVALARRQLALGALSPEPASASELDDGTSSPRRAAGEDLPEVPTTSWWARNFGGARFDRYVPRWLRFTYVASLLVIAVGIWWLFSGSSDDTSSTALFSQAPALAVGSCFNADAGLWLDTVEVVGCAGPHDAQAAAVIELVPAGRSYPDLADLRSEAVVLCIEELRLMVTLENNKTVGASVPSARAWRSGDQRVLCNVIHGGGDKLVGTSL